MKLHESLRKIIRQFGVNVLSEKRLLFILSDFSAFDEYPALKQVFEAIVSCGAGKELMGLSLDDDRAGCISYAQNLKKSLAENSHFREDLADCAVDSILYALGLTDTVAEPSDHGLDPVERNGAGHQDAGWLKGRREDEAKGSAEGRRSSSQEGAGGRSADPRNAGARGPSKAIKWVIAALLLAGVFAGGWLTGSPSREDSGIPDHQTAGSAAGNSVDNDVAGNSAQEVYVPGKAYYADSGEKKQFLPLTDAHGKELPAESDVAPFRKPNGGAGKKSSYADEQQAEAARKEAETMAKAEAEAKQRP